MAPGGDDIYLDARVSEVRGKALVQIQVLRPKSNQSEDTTKEVSIRFDQGNDVEILIKYFNFNRGNTMFMTL